jgi:NADPH:quinone reductase-like Zn-dependent oxidoreductase
MKAIRLHARGGPEAFAYEKAPQPRPGEGEVLVRVHAAAVTSTELVWVPKWTTPPGEPRRFPIILGHEFSGEVAAVGDGVTDPAAGSPVYGLNDWFGDGALAEYCVARVAEVAPKPRSVDHLAAAVTPISALTVWQGSSGGPASRPGTASWSTARRAASGSSPCNWHAGVGQP